MYTNLIIYIRLIRHHWCQIICVRMDLIDHISCRFFYVTSCPLGEKLISTLGPLVRKSIFHQNAAYKGLFSPKEQSKRTISKNLDIVPNKINIVLLYCSARCIKAHYCNKNQHSPVIVMYPFRERIILLLCSLCCLPIYCIYSITEKCKVKPI